MTNGIGFENMDTQSAPTGIVKGPCASSNSQTMYAADFLQKIKKSSNGGQTWEILNSTPGTAQTHWSLGGMSCSVDASTLFTYLDSTMAAPDGSGGFIMRRHRFRSDDGGDLWTSLPAMVRETFPAVHLNFTF